MSVNEGGRQGEQLNELEAVEADREVSEISGQYDCKVINSSENFRESGGSKDCRSTTCEGDNNCQNTSESGEEKENKSSDVKCDTNKTEGLENTTSSYQNGNYDFDGQYHTYTDPTDGTVYFWDRERNGWFPKVDDDFLARYQMNYGFIENQTGIKESEKSETEVPAGVKRKAAPEEPSWFDIDDEHNTKVYVSNLPLDITEQEFVDFMQKCGLVMKDVSTNKWKIKLYKEKDTDQLKGDALCTYIKRESVELALNVLDGADLRGHKVEVQRAKFQMKGEYNPSLKPKKKKRKEKEREKKIQEKLFDWRPDKLRGQRENHERTVIIKNLFEPSTFDNNVELILEYSQDLREECSKCGTIKKLVIHDKHPEGVAQVTFSDAEEADICIKLLNNRWFSQRKITAEHWDGKTKYKMIESEAEEKERLMKWNKYLESGKADT
ncbi:UNVERIFIED_CONTAM: hypothetical protein PYX00_008928 [Menopon gallinae]|uniref:17S U2 SnRNP complex component HTATSF1 n=1 Tax=Menopon gallinae TaxID=328185 RepID=A0AAW2H9G2_9NEOP